MATEKKPHVWYIGEWVFRVRPTVVETPFNTLDTKDCEVHFYGQRLEKALDPVAELTCMPNWDVYRLKPGRLEDHLARSAAVILCDVEAKCIHLYPELFEHVNQPDQILRFPDRVDALKNWVGQGGGLMMVGGWLSFSGARGIGGWRRSRLADAMPVECLVGDDLVESPAGFTPELVQPDHPLIRGLPWNSFPPILGYNELIAKPDAEVVVRVRETGHPLVVTGSYDKGRIYVYASGASPFWGINFEQWEGYDAFWQQALKWVIRDSG